MKAKPLLQSSSFRLVLIYLLLFAGSALALLGFIYLSTVTFTASQMDTTIQSDITGLSEQYRLRGVNGLVASINDRLQQDPDSSSVYLLTAPDLRPVAGNLSSLPPEKVNSNNWMTFQFYDERSGRAFHARARLFMLEEGFSLLVGRDTSVLNDIQQLLQRAMLWGLLIILGLGLFGGIIMSRSMTRRIELINQNSREIIAGNLSKRIPLSKQGSDDIDQLASNLNHMLDEIEHLMLGIQQVSNNIAHDLRTPLTRIRNQLERLQLKFDNNSFYRDSVQECIDDADQLLKTFAALLRIARIEAGGHQTNVETVNLNQLVNDAFELYEALAEDKQVELSIKQEQDLQIDIEGDRDLLFQALANLIDNAIKYTPSAGKITLSIEQSDHYTHLIVADSGPGIAVEEYDKVSQRFYRLETSRNTSGSGLGLSLVKAVALLHHGQLLFADNNPGLIATLHFNKPRP